MIRRIFNNIAPKAYLESIALKLFRPESLQVHYVRDVTQGEDSARIRVHPLPNLFADFS